MLSATKLGYMFQSGDLEWRRRQVTQYFVLKTVKNDPLRATGVYRHLIHRSGEHAAEVFFTLLETARTKSDAFLWHHMVNLTRPPEKPLPQSPVSANR